MSQQWIPVWLKVALLITALFAGAFKSFQGQSKDQMIDSRPIGATAAVWSSWELQIKDALAPFGITGLIEAIVVSGWFCRIQAFFYPVSAAQWEHAQRFYEEQRPLIMESARRFQLHGYWSKHMRVDSLDYSWTDLLTQRMRSMRLQMEQEGREDFKVERDKCDMLEWLERNGFPIPKVVGVWRESPEAFLSDLFDRIAPSNESSWPLFAKICHLTQGVEDSVRMLRSPEWISSHKEDLEGFVKQRWQKLTNDADRIFARDSNALSQDLRPGMVIQNSYKKPVEFKVLVLWGRAYISPLIEYEGVVSRDGFFEQGARNRGWGLEAPVPIEELPHMAWIHSEGHLPRIWQLSEAVALAAGCEQIRVDIFIRRGEPEAISVNEISLSSGATMNMHGEFIGKAWAEPYAKQLYLPYPATTPVDKLDLASGQMPNLQAARESVAASAAPRVMEQ